MGLAFGLQTKKVNWQISNKLGEQQQCMPRLELSIIKRLWIWLLSLSPLKSHAKHLFDPHYSGIMQI